MFRSSFVRSLSLAAVPLLLVPAGCGDDGSGSGASGTSGDTTGVATTDGTSSSTGGTSMGSAGSTSGSTGASTGGSTTTTTTGTGGGTGEPLPPGTPGEWTWVEIPGAMCRDGSPAGLAVRYSDTSDDVVVYFEGGGACYNLTTCLGNPSSVGSKSGGNSGLFNMDNPDNPVADWNHVFIPYCTGDVFAGNKKNADVPGGPSGQMFVGYVNTSIMLDRIVATFPDAANAMISGGSAGGFGAAYNFPQAAEKFGAGVQMILMDDSGPPMDDPYMAPCLQQQWRDIWGLDDTMPQDCTDCFGADGGGIVYMTQYISDTFPDAYVALVSSEEDSTIRGFFGYGENDCNVIVPNMSGAKYKEGLYDLRDNWMVPGGNWSTFIIAGSTHTWIGSNSRFYDTSVGGTRLVDWFSDVVNGTVAQVAP